ncbi:DNA-binding transcriptional LysR family regulator [Povalibacter uvarum]|uniref:DNA-binding transcriptional LysR family regulator n=1 Tax=Povalibacter uvarum TaxID=732238 RepID=A0A841HLJ3_9GAMM|nr:LysR family transcriptional regulator [Povalibacter uvarum]MBB6093229.1 DNA-binding transcriptional LysR family regulator [Povalibacter uvarum]
MQIERNEIRCFHAVVEAGGFSRAAERLDLSQSAVSQAIANLEHRLGAVLLRRGSPPQLTEAGIRMLRFAEAMMNEERETLADIAQIKSGARSTLSLALSPAANARFGVSLLKEFSERNPLTRFKIAVTPSREIVYGVSDGRWELGFGPLQHSMPDYFAFHACFSETRRLMIAADHPSRDALRRDPQETLRTLPLITSFLDDIARRPSGDRLRNAFASVWEVSHMDLRLALVAEGKGLTYLSDLVTNTPANLVPIEGLPFSSIDRQVGVYYLKHQPMSQAGARFVALCRERWGF